MARTPLNRIGESLESVTATRAPGRNAHMQMEPAVFRFGKFERKLRFAPRPLANPNGAAQHPSHMRGCRWRGPRREKPRARPHWAGEAALPKRKSDAA